MEIESLQSILDDKYDRIKELETALKNLLKWVDPYAAPDFSYNEAERVLNKQ